MSLYLHLVSFAGKAVTGYVVPVQSLGEAVTHRELFLETCKPFELMVTEDLEGVQPVWNFSRSSAADGLFVSTKFVQGQGHAA